MSSSKYAMRRALEDVKRGRAVHIDSSNFEADIDAIFGKEFQVRTRKMQRRIAKLERTEVYYIAPHDRAERRAWMQRSLDKIRNTMDRHGFDSMEYLSAPAPISPRPGRWPGPEQFKCVR